MSKHIESIVPRLPVRDADRAPGQRPAAEQPSARRTEPLVPVHEIPGLAPHERIGELRLRVQSGVYARHAVVEQVARTMQARGVQGA